MSNLETTARPDSATGLLSQFAGAVGFLVVFSILSIAAPSGDPVIALIAIVAGIAICVLCVDILVYRVHQRPNAGLDFSRRSASISRAGVKTIGLYATLGLVAAAYWIFPQYGHDNFTNWFKIAYVAGSVIALVGPAYIWFVDSHMIEPRDGLWHFGALLTARRGADTAAAGQYLLGWTVKAFFLPLMFTYACNNLLAYMGRPLPDLLNLHSVFGYGYNFLFFADVVFATAGYALSLRLFDTHLRSTDSTMLGWASALACYDPFWAVIGAQYLTYESGRAWGAIFNGHPIFWDVWAVAILTLVAIYAWATISFGLRFSNLTHRGIITNGPYRFSKHPAYIAKNLSWWMISMPFMTGPWDVAVKHSLMLLGLNGLYALRAWTEERHLSRDPDYVAYTLWMESHGLFRFLAPLHGLAASVWNTVDTPSRQSTPTI